MSKYFTFQNLGIFKTYLYSIIKMFIIRMNFMSPFQWWECKLLVLLNNFALEATYFWLLIEGLYLHNAIFYSIFRETKVWLYAAAGWGTDGF